MNNVAYFEIQADEPKRCADFYTAVFDWTFFLDPVLPTDYWQIQNAGPNGGMMKRPAKTPPPMSGTNAFVCSVQVEDFDMVADAILKNGGVVALDKFAVPGRCWQGYFLDTEGNTFGIFEVDEDAK